MAVIEFSIDFFSRIVMESAEKLHFCIISRLYNDSQIPPFRTPGIRVDGVNESVFSITDVSFIELGGRSDSVVVCEDADVELIGEDNEDGTVDVDNKEKKVSANKPHGWILSSVSGVSCVLTERELICAYVDRVVNPLLK